MSELKAYNVVATADVNPEVVDILGCTEWFGYDKVEVDKVIAEKDAEIAKLQAMLEERNKQVGELKEERRWRKFPDEKPKHNGIFFVLIGERARTLDTYDTNKGMFRNYRPTAWMPLPPEEAK